MYLKIICAKTQTEVNVSTSTSRSQAVWFWELVKFTLYKS